ncbi:MAG TPA: agmatinase, partial [Acetobacteraceae bacterium]|nr:agmatinase [Acetobacteraceae bacterium]
MNAERRLRPLDPSVSPRFGDVATLLRAPRVPPGPDIDIALVGVPFDLGTNYRTGARGGPAAVREASRTIRLVHPTSRIAPFDLCEVADVGDVAINALDMAASLATIEAFFRDLHVRHTTPIAVGGDHTIPLPILRAIAKDRPVGLVQFDAHPDTLDTLMGTRINHATTFRRAVEEGLLDAKRTVQVGLRGSMFGADDASWSRQAGMRVITMDEFEQLGRARVIEEIGRVIGDGPTYVSFDIDGLDAANAMGTGVPEVGGYSVRDAQVMLQSLRGRHLVGADLCEVAPMYDPTGQTAL